MVPNNTILAFFASRKIIDAINIKIKPEKINQKEPTSSIVPNKDKLDAPPKIADKNTTNTTTAPANNEEDLGIMTSPSKNLATIQKITDIIAPRTRNKPLLDSTGILVKGRKKIGNKTTTNNEDRSDNLPTIFEFIFKYYTTN